MQALTFASLLEWCATFCMHFLADEVYIAVMACLLLACSCFHVFTFADEVTLYSQHFTLNTNSQISKPTGIN